MVFEVVIGDFEGGVIQPTAAICPGDSFQFEAYGGSVYSWSPGIYLNDSTIATPIATVDQTTDFMIIISDTCGIDTVYVTLPVFLGASNISNDTSICLGNSVLLNAEGGVSYEWTPATFLDDPFSPTPTSTPDETKDLLSCGDTKPGECTYRPSVREGVRVGVLKQNVTVVKTPYHS